MTTSKEKRRSEDQSETAQVSNSKARSVMTKTEIESKCLSDEGRDSSILSALSPERHRELFDRVEEAIWECEEAGNICSHLHCAYIAGFSRDEVDAAIACMMTIALVRMPIDELARA